MDRAKAEKHTCEMVHITVQIAPRWKFHRKKYKNTISRRVSTYHIMRRLKLTEVRIAVTIKRIGVELRLHGAEEEPFSGPHRPINHSTPDILIQISLWMPLDGAHANRPAVPLMLYINSGVLDEAR